MYNFSSFSSLVGTNKLVLVRRYFALFKKKVSKITKVKNFIVYILIFVLLIHDNIFKDLIVGKQTNGRRKESRSTILTRKLRFGKLFRSKSRVPGFF